MLERLSQRWSLPVAGTSLSAGAALRALDVGRVALVHPPWFDDELNNLRAMSFRSQGFDVVSSESADLPNDPRLLEPGAIVEWISRHLDDDAEAVFTCLTGEKPVLRGAGDFDLELLENRTLDGHMHKLIYRPTLH